MSKTPEAVLTKANSFGWTLCDGWQEMDRARIEALVEAIRLMDKEGYNQSQALREVVPSLGIVPRSLYNWAAVRGMQLPNPGLHQTAHMTEALKTYAKEHRLDLGNRMIDIVEETVNRLERSMSEDQEFIPQIRELREMAVTFGILTDKRRLEDGDPTSRHEISAESIRLEIVAKLDKLEQRHIESGDIVDAEIVEEDQ